MGCRIQQHTNDKQNLLAKSAENMLLAINKQIQIYHVMTYIYIRQKKRNNKKKKTYKIYNKKHTHTQIEKKRN